MNITYDQVKAIVRPNGKRELIEGFVEYFNKHAETFGVNNYLRTVHFVAQCAHESAYFNTMEEYASGAAYEGRADLGNTQRGDGKRYKGRGYIQITGRSNYRRYGKIIGYDLENNPELAEDTEISVLISLAYWQKNGLNDFADADNIKTITKRINGGYNGLQDRINYTNKAKAQFKAASFNTNEVDDGDDETFVDLTIGSRGPNVKKFQESLVKYGYKVDVDGAFGPNTQNKVKELQGDLDMPVTGIVDAVLFDILTVDGIEDA